MPVQRLEKSSIVTTSAHRVVGPVDVYDTTLRDGAQQEGMNLSVADKLAIAPLLDELGVSYIEGGWPGAVPKDTEFFGRAAKELSLQNAVLCAFGATRKAGITASSDPQVRGLLDSEAEVITLVAKSDIRHVERALRTTGAENLAMIADTVSFLVLHGRRVFLDAEHFFDAYQYDSVYALSALQTAAEAGAEVLILCDTNGGQLPSSVYEITSAVAAHLGIDPDSGALADPTRYPVASLRLGMHAHNDTGCAVANSIAAVQGGARHVQGTVNGYGERTGNAELLTVLANLELKLGAQRSDGHGRTVVGSDAPRLEDITRISHAISEITNIAPFGRQPYVGNSAFAHKAGLHASAIKVDPDLYQHIDPKVVGNDMRMLVSEMAGRASIELKGKELGFDLAGQSELLTRVTEQIKSMEAEGYTFDAADASFELILHEQVHGSRPSYFDTESWRVAVRTHRGDVSQADAEATVKIHAGGRRLLTVGEGNGPVNALDYALRSALGSVYPEIERFELTDFKVRILDAQHGTGAVTRVLIETRDTETDAVWRTVGVGPNIIEGSWEAIVDSINYGLLHAGIAPR